MYYNANKIPNKKLNRLEKKLKFQYNKKNIQSNIQEIPSIQFHSI